MNLPASSPTGRSGSVTGLRKTTTRSYRGPVSLKLALTKSINTIPVRLSLDFGRDKIMETAYAMGLTHELENSISCRSVLPKCP